ncbi:MAG: RidA family protein [Gemmobacter sp.]
MTHLPARADLEALPDGAPAAGPLYSRAGPFVFVSGVAAGEGADIRAQTAATIEALRDILRRAGGDLENLVEVTTYLVSMGDFAGYNDVYSRYFSPEGPARTTVAVERLPRPSQLIELRGTAYIATNGSDR